MIENRRDEFGWAVKTYGIFTQQVDSDGYLPNELKNTRLGGNVTAVFHPSS